MFSRAGKHRQEDADKRRPVGEERTKITPEQQEKANTPTERGKPGKHRAK